LTGGASAGSAPFLRGERVVLRPVRRTDAEGLAAILGEPNVARWWGVGAADPAVVAQELVAAQDEVVFAIEHGGELIGSVQYSEETDPDYRHAGIDNFLTSSRHGRGFGPETLRVLARYLFDERGHHRIVIDPAADNERAIRA
jgi:aminoglycoside 6'-N-acetyltransferase